MSDVNGNGNQWLNCVICWEDVVMDDNHRTPVKLRCGHNFHLDCIGSHFNAKNKMECPTCRQVEEGEWLFAQQQQDNSPIPQVNLGVISEMTGVDLLDISSARLSMDQRGQRDMGLPPLEISANQNPENIRNSMLGIWDPTWEAMMQRHFEEADLDNDYERRLQDMFMAGFTGSDDVGESSGAGSEAVVEEVARRGGSNSDNDGTVPSEHDM